MTLDENWEKGELALKGPISETEVRFPEERSRDTVTSQSEMVGKQNVAEDAMPPAGG